MGKDRKNGTKTLITQHLTIALHSLPTTLATIRSEENCDDCSSKTSVNGGDNYCFFFTLFSSDSAGSAYFDVRKDDLNATSFRKTAQVLTAESNRKLRITKKPFRPQLVRRGNCVERVFFLTVFLLVAGQSFLTRREKFRSELDAVPRVQKIRRKPHGFENRMVLYQNCTCHVCH